MNNIQAVWHFVRAVLVGYAVGLYAYNILIDELVPIDVLIYWPYIEAGFILSSFIGGVVLGLTPNRLRKGGLWMGSLFAFTYIAIQTFVMIISVSMSYNMHHDRWQKFLVKVLFDWTWRSMLVFLCCALAGYCGQLRVGKWRRGRQHTSRDAIYRV